MLAHLLFIFCLEWVLIIKVHVLMSVSYLFFLQASNIEKECKYGQQNLTSENNENSSVSSLINRFEQINNIPNKPTDDHAIVDDVDVKQLKVILGHEPENKDIADIQDNKTDDDQPDLELDDSSGDKSKIKQDISMEGFTETTDITTPIEMAQESGPSKGVDFDTSYQISDLPEWSKYDLRMSTPETHHKLKSETLFDITDLDDLSDVEEDMIQKDNVFMSYSDRTLVPDRTMTQEEDSSPHIIETKIRIREDKIHEKFEKMSMSMSDPENTAEGEEFCQLSTSVLSKEDEEQAASNFDKILVDNFVEDKSEDWLTHESDPSPEKETGSGEIFGPPEKEKADGVQGKRNL